MNVKYQGTTRTCLSESSKLQNWNHRFLVQERSLLGNIRWFFIWVTRCINFRGRYCYFERIFVLWGLFFLLELTRAANLELFEAELQDRNWKTKRLSPVLFCIDHSSAFLILCIVFHSVRVLFLGDKKNEWEEG